MQPVKKMFLVDSLKLILEPKVPEIYYLFNSMSKLGKFERVVFSV
jgi:hypothetical protein